MKLKKKTCGILAVLLLLITVFTGMQEVMPVYAEGLKVSINGTRGWQILCIRRKQREWNHE